MLRRRQVDLEPTHVNRGNLQRLQADLDRAELQFVRVDDVVHHRFGTPLLGVLALPGVLIVRTGSSPMIRLGLLDRGVGRPGRLLDGYGCPIGFRCRVLLRSPERQTDKRDCQSCDHPLFPI